MQLKVSSQAAVLYLSGTVHRETADEVDAAFNTALDSGAPVVIVSFQDVKALLSDGIRLMIALCDRAHQNNREFFITDLPKEVRYALQITNLLTMLGHAGYTLNLLKERQIDAQLLKQQELIFTRSLPELQAQEGITKETAAPKPTPAVAQPAPAPVRPAPAAPKPAPMPKPAPAVAHHAPKQLTEAELRNYIHSHTPGRVEFRIAEYMSRSGVNIKNLHDISLVLRSDKNAIIDAMKRLISRGTVKAVGGGLFNYSGSEEQREIIRQITLRLQNPDLHSATLKLLMDSEHH